MPENCWGFNFETPTPVRISSVKGEAKIRVVTISLSPQGGAYTRARKSEKSLSPPIPVGVCWGGGGVDTNDWCITANSGNLALNSPMHICQNVDFFHREIFLKPILVLSRSYFVTLFRDARIAKLKTRTDSLPTSITYSLI